MGQSPTLPDTPAERVNSALQRLLAGPEGERRVGPFVLLRQLGHGGFAPVWLAREEYGDVELRSVALKVFALDAGDPESSLGRQARLILEEARALCQVEHPNVVRFYSIAYDERLGLLGLAMEYLGGRPLDRTLVEHGPLPVARALDVALSVASALAAVHRNGVVHRDVKPANIVETTAGYKLIDFGIALDNTASEGDQQAADVPLSSRGSRRSASTATPTTQVLSGRPQLLELCGTMGYIDPECIARSARAGRESDLYALGATLFELLTGKLPAEVGSVLRGDVLDGRVRPKPLASLRVDVPSQLCELVDSLLQPRRAERPRSAEWVASRLQQIRYQLAGKQRQLPNEERGPFRGLARFEAEDQGVHFGRTLEIAQALQLLRVRGLVALLGPSGSGKSSLARAGLVPSVLEGELGAFPASWDSIIAAPGEDPRATLLERLEPLIGRGDGTPRWVLSALAERSHVTGRGLVLLIDQLEELATLARPESRDWLAELLALFGEQPLPGVRAIATARRDLLDPLLGLSGLGRALLRSSVLVEPMTADTWTEVLELALSAYGYGWESESLKQRVAAEIQRTASAMPLVQFALGRLWASRDTARKVLTSASFETMGGIAGALAQHADATLSQLVLTSPTAEATARRVLLSLTTAQGTSAVKPLARIEREAGALAPRVLDAFEEARLIVRLPNGYTLAHEVLLSEWPRLQAWLVEAREARELAEALEHDAARWKLDPESVPLWRRRRLTLAQDVLREAGLELHGDAQSFFAAGLKAEKRRRGSWGAAIVVASAALLFVAVAYVRGIESERARTQAALQRAQESRSLADARNQEVQRAQQRIDELLGDMTSSPQKAEVLALQQRIREQAVTTPPPARLAPRSQPEPNPPPEQKAQVLPSPSAEPRMRVQDRW